MPFLWHLEIEKAGQMLKPGHLIIEILHLWKKFIDNFILRAATVAGSRQQNQYKVKVADSRTNFVKSLLFVFFADMA